MNKKFIRVLTIQPTKFPKYRLACRTRVRADLFYISPSLEKGVYIGPSIEGLDKEYIKVVSGKVTDRKPSFID